MRKTFIATAALVAASAAQAAISIPAATAVYGQTFDALSAPTGFAPWANDSTLAGWSLFNSAGSAITTYRASSGTDTTGAFYSFGSAAGERALGGLGSAGTYYGGPAAGTVAGYIAVAFSNASGAPFDSFTVGFDGEQWRNGGNTTPQPMVMEWGFGASFGAVASWTMSSGGTWMSPIATSAAAAVDGNAAGLVSGLGDTVITTWAPGDTLWIRWTERNDAGSDHGLAIDNFTLSVTAPIPEPGTTALLLAGLATVGFMARRRRG